MSDRPISEWCGVKVENGRVTELYLSNNQLEGTIPAELGDLTALKYLSLYNNKLEGPIPAQLGQLKALEDLFLHNNNLSGEVPAELCQLTALTQLVLSNNYQLYWSGFCFPLRYGTETPPRVPKMYTAGTFRFVRLAGNSQTGSV